MSVSTIAFAISLFISVDKLFFCVPVAQWIARWTSNPKAVGSYPTRDDLLFQNVCVLLMYLSSYFMKHIWLFSLSLNKTILLYGILALVAQSVSELYLYAV